MKPSPEEMHVFLDWLNQERARAEVEDWERAVGFVVRTHENEFGRTSLYGVFEDPVQAFRYAEKFQNDLNHGLTEDQIDAEGWRCEVFPLLPVDES